ncbi:MAG: MBL fold metallo-hydrolase [Gaiellaceae bacterium]
MLFRQFVDVDLGCASYLIGDESSGEAAVVDPAYAIEQYLAEAKKQKARIVRVLETHTHADHVSGHGRFALEHGIPVSVHPAAEPEFEFDPLEDGQEIELGEVTIRVLHTPGHRPEHCCFAVIVRSRGDDPWLVITGDSLLVGDAARPDLASAAEEGARGMFVSLQRLLDLPDGVQVYPGHVAGSLCGASMSSMHSSTIGFERRFNHKLELVGRDEDEFVSETTNSLAPRPPNMERIVALNRGPFVAAQPPMQRADSDGATVLDVRPTREFAAGHIEGAFSVPVSGSQFAT